MIAIRYHLAEIHSLAKQSEYHHKNEVIQNIFYIYFQVIIQNDVKQKIQFLQLANLKLHTENRLLQMQIVERKKVLLEK